MLKRFFPKVAILVPVIELVINVWNFPLPMQKFTGWSVSTLIAELFIYFVYISCKNRGYLDD